MVTLTFAMVCD